MGAAYLIYLGISSLLTKTNSPTVDTTTPRYQSNAKIFWQGFTSDVLNPKVALFFLALLPQFVPAHSGNPTMQLLLLGLTVNIIALPINLALVFASARVTQSLRRSNRVAAALHKAMGLIFVGLGLRLVAEKS
jgi:threonine/homoserine/homoserine lactone efflux protein